MLIDTHAHLNFNAYKDDVDEVIRRTLDKNVWMINVGSNYINSERAVRLAEKNEKGVFAAIGLHPINLETGLIKNKSDSKEGGFSETSFDYEKYKKLAQSKKVVAIGEIGLDYYYRPKTKKKLGEFKEEQKQVFIKQLDLAKELNLPVIFHCRFAHDDLLDLLESGISGRKPRGVVHCFTGNWEQAKRYLEMGFYIGLNGIIFKLDLNEVIKNTALDRILTETDCPYLIPLAESLKNIERNEPLYVKYVAEKISEIKKIPFEEVERNTANNAKKLFNL